MTEKRFISLDEGYDLIIRDTITHNDLCDVESIIDVLNDYEKENEQLRQVMGFLQNDNTNDILTVLNSRERTFEQLTEENQQYKILTDELKRQNKKLKARLNDLGVEYYD